jgi:hypothetical protein
MLCSVADFACFIRWGSKSQPVKVFVNGTEQRVTWCDDTFTNSIRFLLPSKEKAVVLSVNGPIPSELDRIEMNETNSVASVYFNLSG